MSCRGGVKIDWVCGYKGEINQDEREGRKEPGALPTLSHVYASRVAGRGPGSRAGHNRRAAKQRPWDDGLNGWTSRTTRESVDSPQ
jgi:hypothetical protein